MSSRLSHPPPVPAPSRLDRLRVRHLRLLEQVARRGSLSAAAEPLGISQPSATKLLQDMERTLQCSLVDRSTRGGVLTDTGRLVLERLGPALQAIDRVPDAVAGSPRGQVVHLGLLPLAGITLLPALLQRLRHADPPIRLALREGSVSGLLGQLRQGNLDGVISRLLPDPVGQDAGSQDLSIVPLDDDPYEAACAPGHPLARRRALPLAALATLPWVLPPRDTNTRQAFEAAFVGQGMPAPLPEVESPSFHVSFALLARNPQLVTLAPRSAVRYYAALGIVRALRLEGPFPTGRLVFMARPERLAMPALAQVAQLLQALGASAAPVAAARRRC